MNLSRRDFIGLSAGAFAIGLVGCAGKPTVQKEPQAATEAKEQDKPTLEVADSGFYMDEYGSAHFAAKITNNSTEYAAAQVDITASAKDTDGKILGTYPCLLSAIYPNGSAFVGGNIPVSGEVKTVEFTIADKKDMWQKTKQTQDEYTKTFYAENLNVTNDGIPQVTGEAISTSKYDFQQSKVIAVLMDNSGKIIGGDCTYLDNLTAGAKQPFSVFLGKMPEYKDVIAYVDAGAKK